MTDTTPREPQPWRAEDETEQLRRQRLSGRAIARRLGRPVSTIGVALRRHRLGRLSALDPRPSIIRYERQKPGERVHIEIKKLGRIDGVGHRITGDRIGQSNRRSAGRGLGWEYVPVAIDDASRLACTELLADERKQSAVTFTARAIDWFARNGVVVEHIMSDNITIATCSERCRARLRNNASLDRCKEKEITLERKVSLVCLPVNYVCRDGRSGA